MSTESNNNLSQEASRWMRDMFEELNDMFEELFPDADKLNLEEMQRRLDGLIRRKTANDCWGGHNGAGRPVSSWRWRLGPARSAATENPWGVWGCFHICRPSSVPRFPPRKM
jgi:hypothetical protein